MSLIPKSGCKFLSLALLDRLISRPMNLSGLSRIDRNYPEFTENFTRIVIIFYNIFFVPKTL